MRCSLIVFFFLLLRGKMLSEETVSECLSSLSLCLPLSLFPLPSFPSNPLVGLQAHVLCLCEVISCLKETGWKMWFHLRKSIKRKKEKNRLRLIQVRGDSGRKHYLWLFKNNFPPFTSIVRSQVQSLQYYCSSNFKRLHSC